MQSHSAAKAPAIVLSSLKKQLLAFSPELFKDRGKEMHLLGEEPSRDIAHI